MVIIFSSPNEKEEERRQNNKDLKIKKGKKVAAITVSLRDFASSSYYALPRFSRCTQHADTLHQFRQDYHEMSFRSIIIELRPLFYCFSQ